MHPMAKAVKAAKKSTKAAPKKETKAKASKVDFAVVKVAGTQLLVKEGVTYKVNRVEQEKGDKMTSEEVLLVASPDGVKVGTPYVKGAKVEFEVTSHKKDKKLRVFKYKAKARYRKTIGHRALLSKLTVRKIQSA
jgi:large subunit ribosomal protein L21